VDPAGQPVVVPIDTAKPLPCIEVEPKNLNFPFVPPGAKELKSVKVSNCGAVPLHLTGWQLAPSTPVFLVALAGGAAACKDFPKTPCVLAAGEWLDLGVTFTPDDSPLAHKAVLAVAYDGGPPVAAQLTGTTLQAPCPKPVVSVKEGEEVVPQTTLHLVGDKSVDAQGKPVKMYKWTFKQPPGANQSLAPNGNFPNPALTANVAGEYEFCLEVWDAAYLKSCQPACVQVLVVPNNALHVELLWDTPADPDQADTGPMAGADMDLHFAHEMASGSDQDCDGKADPWFNNLFDCFWFNSSVNWGSTDPAVQDDPTLELDDTDGAGPENLNLAEPEDMAYAVGVNYANDHGFGPSYATVRVFLYGSVTFELAKVKMNPLDMWYVGKIDWTNQSVTACYQSGDACSGKGKLWQAKGDLCITPCYVGLTFTSGTPIPIACQKKP
jgi:hypothetical protein